MSFDYVRYHTDRVLAPEESWRDKFAWYNIVVVSATEAYATNSDGTVTVFTGDGFDIGDGPFEAGVVSSVQRMNAAQDTVIEQYDLIDIDDSAPGHPHITGTTTLSYFRDHGLDVWLTAGNDQFETPPFAPVLEAEDGGADTLWLLPSNIKSYVINGFVENVVYAGSNSVYLRGSDKNNLIVSDLGTDRLLGNRGDDTLDGGAGSDWMYGMLGNDTFVVDSLTDHVIEKRFQGNDTIKTYLNVYTLGRTVENLEFIGTGDSNLTGNIFANKFVGGAGIDVMTGLAGDDTYVVGQDTDVVVEALAEGTDTVETELATYSLGANVENLKFVHLDPEADAVAHTGYGNELDNLIKGDEADDHLLGLAGNDTLDGGGDEDADTLEGGEGDDTYVVQDTLDVIVEKAGEGTDTVEAFLSEYTLLDNFENLILRGDGKSEELKGYGNGADNSITGSNFSDDYLDGGAGNDLMTGMDGNDTYVVSDAGDVVVEQKDRGNDTVLTSLASYTLADNVENVTYIGGGTSELTGNVGDNRLGGGDGTVTLIGLGGNDTYVISTVGKTTVVESADGGIDAIETTLGTYTLTEVNVENLYFAALDPSSGSSISHTGYGSGGANEIRGELEADVLYGLGGNDTLDGGVYVDPSSGEESADWRADTLDGGTGDDTYIVRDSLDVVIEAKGEGTDTVDTDISYIELAANVENLVATRVTGTPEKNDIEFRGYGNDLANKITCGATDDFIDGGAGADTMIGGAGNDYFVIDQAGDVVIELAGQGFDVVEVPFATYKIKGAIEGVVHRGSSDFTGTGNGEDNWVIGGDGADLLRGLGGNDTLSGNDVADGKVDRMEGGGGDDHYYIWESIDILVEAASGGTDTVVTDLATFTLAANFENLDIVSSGGTVHHGIGNSVANILDGGGGAEWLEGRAGNDSLNGGYYYSTVWSRNIGDQEVDTLEGGTGNDVYEIYGDEQGDYFLDGSNNEIIDLIVEKAGEGIDTVKVYTNHYEMADEIEKLTIENGERGSFRSATGNALANTMTGGESDDSLDGGAGNDTLAGGAGNDIYVVDSTYDKVVEAKDAGYDIVQATAAIYTLAKNVEELVFTNADAHTGNGNALDNFMTGGGGVDVLRGFTGSDTLDGGYVVDPVDGSIDPDGMADRLEGGLGDDTYFVRDSFDLVIELSLQGNDTVVTALTSYVLPVNVERLVLLEDPDNIVDVRFEGNKLGNVIETGRGDDTLIGGAGNDTLLGGSGKDTFYFTAGDGKDVIQDFRTATVDAAALAGPVSGADKISLYGITTLTDWASVEAAMTQTDAGVLISTDSSSSILLLGVKKADLSASDFIFDAP